LTIAAYGDMTIGDMWPRVAPVYSHNYTPLLQRSTWASTSTCWHFSFVLCCHSNATGTPICKSA